MRDITNQGGENLILDAKVLENMICHLTLFPHLAEKMIIHKNDLPNLGENLKSNLVQATQILYNIWMKLRLFWWWWWGGGSYIVAVGQLGAV